MSLSLDDTIAAIASAGGAAPRGILRISGPQVVACLRACFWDPGRGAWTQVRGPRIVTGQFQLSHPTTSLPCTLYFWPGRRSYTGQPSAEVHAVGCQPLLERALFELYRAGARPAQPGEFTMRAFLSGRIDLTQAEAVLGVIDARNHHELQLALDQLAGGVSRKLTSLRNQLLDLCADLEAGLDFADEDIVFVPREELRRRLQTSISAVQEVIAQMQSRLVADTVRRIALLGHPNVGKSSLLNALTNSSAALVSPTAGTTRDYVTRRMALAGLKCELVDTAGIHPSHDQELEGEIQRTVREQHQQADLAILCIDSSRRLTPLESELLRGSSPVARLVVLTKCDLPRKTGYRGPALEVSAVTGSGLDALRSAIRSALVHAHGGAGELVASTALRCGDALRLLDTSLHRACRLAAEAGQEELVAAELRVGLEQLGLIVGDVVTEDILDRVFSRFCIGK